MLAGRVPGRRRPRCGPRHEPPAPRGGSQSTSECPHPPRPAHEKSGPARTPWPLPRGHLRAPVEMVPRPGSLALGKAPSLQLKPCPHSPLLPPAVSHHLMPFLQIPPLQHRFPRGPRHPFISRPAWVPRAGRPAPGPGLLLLAIDALPPTPQPPPPRATSHHLTPNSWRPRPRGLTFSRSAAETPSRAGQAGRGGAARAQPSPCLPRCAHPAPGARLGRGAVP